MLNSKPYFIFFAVFYLILLGWLLLFYQRDGMSSPQDRVNLIPFNSIRSWYFFAEKHQWQRGTGLYFWNNLLGNVFLLMPFAFLLKIYKRKLSWQGLFLGAIAFSFFLEMMQWLFHRGKADIDDLILNSFGALLAFYAASLCINIFSGVGE